ncbi:translation initiation factor IF-2 [Acetivibrio saccincola]|uniref:Translation initiation factor IF-2 n=1 Tax=Acetivibrio saccincola TaxID=1677857 RepID=A0A2K9EN42_9FIRM|nr:translation initiation factor IF-2 [Acetivibrio saccincola]AUG58031.1 Translation initiation factor IF-2 [Acetivibrio saccincola]
MTRKRVYEIAKELNTTSKRLIEKLSEINIVVKNHMSLLESDEIDSLYDYIGVIRHDEEKEEAQATNKKPIPIIDEELKEELKKEAKKAPRIIRKVEINLDSEEDLNKSGDKGQKKDGKDKHKKAPYVKVATSTSGLRPGLVRETKLEPKRPVTKTSEKEKEAEKKKTENEVKDAVVSEKKNDTAVSDKDLKQGEQSREKQLDTVKPVEAPNEEKQKNKSKKAEESEDKKQEAADKKSKESKKSSKKTEKVKEQKGSKESESHKADSKIKDESKKDAKDTKPAAKVAKEDKGKETKETIVKDKTSSKEAKKAQEMSKADLKSIQKEQSDTRQRGERRDFKEGREGRRDISKTKKAYKTKNKPNKNIFAAKKEVAGVLSDDEILDEFYDEKVKKPKKAKKDNKKDKKENQVPPKAVLTSVKLGETMTVKEFAEAIKKTSADVIKRLMKLGVMATVNQEIDFDTAAIIADEYGITAEKEVVITEEDILFDDSEDDNEDELVPRPPVVVVMGHVDHGKTSLLDAIKETNVTEKEAGGITQHIGAYTVNINNRNITFLDTPGHEAFTAMRARGAQVTDVAILVVAADDGVMPQTIEAINHAKAANVSIIVAINKIDRPEANPDRVKQELAEHGLLIEEWGGDTICVEVSAKKRINIDYLLEMVLLVADMLELKANPNRQAKGTVIEAKLDKDRGPIATMLVQRGTLHHGDSIVTGTLVGRIRAMTDDKGQRIMEAGPSTPVEILGLPEVPEAGETFYAITDEKIAKQLVEKRKQKLREQMLNPTVKVSLDDLFERIKAGEVKELNIIVKADVQGSVEAIKQSLEKLSNEEVGIKIIHGGVGAVTESDVTLAQVSNAIIIGFNVGTAGNVTEIAKDAGVDIRLYTVIYDAIEDVEAAMKGLLDPTYREVITGHVEIRQLFKASGVGTIGGGYVLDGKIIRNSGVRVLRNGIVVHEGKLASLKRFKDDVKEVVQGYECGLSLEKYNDIKVGDVIEAYVMEEVRE